LKPTGHYSNKFTMASKLEPKNLSKKASHVPGPGTYDVRTIPGVNYMITKYKNTTNILWAIDKSPRFNHRDLDKVPGPEKYDVKPLISRENGGKIFESKYKSQLGRTMGSRYYDSRKKFNNVGPGSYKVYSDFGIYESKNKDKFLEQEKDKFNAGAPSKSVKDQL